MFSPRTPSDPRTERDRKEDVAVVHVLAVEVQRWLAEVVRDAHETSILCPSLGTGDAGAQMDDDGLRFVFARSLSAAISGGHPKACTKGLLEHYWRLMSQHYVSVAYHDFETLSRLCTIMRSATASNLSDLSEAQRVVREVVAAEGGRLMFLERTKHIFLMFVPPSCAATSSEDGAHGHWVVALVSTEEDGASSGRIAAQSSRRFITSVEYVDSGCDATMSDFMEPNMALMKSCLELYFHTVQPGLYAAERVRWSNLRVYRQDERRVPFLQPADDETSCGFFCVGAAHRFSLGEDPSVTKEELFDGLVPSRMMLDLLAGRIRSKDWSSWSASCSMQRFSVCDTGSATPTRSAGGEEECEPRNPFVEVPNRDGSPSTDRTKPFGKTRLCEHPIANDHEADADNDDPYGVFELKEDDGDIRPWGQIQCDACNIWRRVPGMECVKFSAEHMVWFCENGGYVCNDVDAAQLEPAGNERTESCAAGSAVEAGREVGSKRKRAPAQQADNNARGASVGVDAHHEGLSTRAQARRLRTLRKESDSYEHGGCPNQVWKSYEHNQLRSSQAYAGESSYGPTTQASYVG